PPHSSIMHPPPPGSTRLPYTTLFRSQSGNVRSAIAEALGHPQRATVNCSHRPPDSFVPKQELQIVLSTETTARPISGLMHYRHRSEEHTSELQSLAYLVCRLLLEKKK